MSAKDKAAVWQHHADPVSKKVIKHLGERSVFIMYVKRHNGARKIAFMGTGAQITDVLDYYHAYKIFQNDRKYLYHRLSDEAADAETKILMENGKGEMRMERNAPGRKRISYESGEMSAMKNIPITLLNGLDEFTSKGHIINSQVMTKTRLICILMAEFLDMREEDRVKYLTSGDLLLENHKLRCGGISPERIEKVNHIEEDLL